MLIITNYYRYLLCAFHPSYVVILLCYQMTSPLLEASSFFCCFLKKKKLNELNFLVRTIGETYSLFLEYPTPQELTHRVVVHRHKTHLMTSHSLIQKPKKLKCLLHKYTDHNHCNLHIYIHVALCEVYI